ncbi:Schwann cell myelin protein [Halotydeus destructor]|nr:Schwann cell myelin protein [Halotydeus destructor]
MKENKAKSTSATMSQCPVGGQNQERTRTCRPPRPPPTSKMAANMGSLLFLTQLALCGHLAAGAGRVHVANHFLHEQASLPCDVDFANCGNIYFLTWSKNVSGEWHRVYLYSQSYETALGDFAFGGGSRVHLDAVNMTATGVAHLLIKSLVTEDEGMYKCDVTYVHGKCPSLTYTELFTLVTPAEPVIKVNGKELSDIERKHHLQQTLDGSSLPVNETLVSGSTSGVTKTESILTVGSFDESSTMTLECSTVGGRPVPEVRWYNGSRPMRSKVTMSSTPLGPTVMATVRFILSRYDLGARFTCRIWNNATKEPLSASVALDIHVKPLSLRLYGPSTPVVAGEMVTLKCTVDGARPAATIDWFNRSEIVSPHPVASNELMTDGTFRYDRKRDFFCMGTNQLLKNRHEVPLIEPITLRVLYPPAIKLEPEGRVATNESDSVTIKCTFDANPPNVTEVIWYRSGHALSGPGPLGDTLAMPRGRGSVRQPFMSYENGVPTLYIANVTRNDSASYSCHMKNAFGRGNSTTDAFIDVYYPPNVVIQVEPSLAIENSRQTVALLCLVVDGNPKTLERVTWFKNGLYLDTSNSDTYLLANVSWTDEANYSCQGFNGATRPSPVSSPKELRVQSVAGVVLIVGATLVVAGMCVVRQRLKNIGVPLEHRRTPGSGIDGRLSDRYATMALESAYQKQMLSKLPLIGDVQVNHLGHQVNHDGRYMMTIVTDCDQLSSSVSCSSPLKSPLIRPGAPGPGHTVLQGNCAQLQNGAQSPLLSEYVTDEESAGVGDSADGSVSAHFYERPASLVGPTAHYATSARGQHATGGVASHNNSQLHVQQPSSRSPASQFNHDQQLQHYHYHSSLHHLNIPLPALGAATPPTAALALVGPTISGPPLPPERRYQPHYARPPTQDELAVLHQLTLPLKGQNNLRPFVRTRSRNGFGSEFH